MNLPSEDLLRIFGVLVGAKGLPTPCLTALIVVALNPGISINDLCEKLDSPQQTVSRHIGILLNRYEESTAPIVTKPFVSQNISEDDPRKRSLSITKAGEQFLFKLLIQ